MYLVDTNVWLELLLDQEHAGDVRRFLDQIQPAELALSEFSLYSIGIILTRLSKDAFHLDFDDAYQYAAAETHNMTLVSFDADFDKTSRGRCTPQQVTTSRTTVGRQHKQQHGEPPTRQSISVIGKS